MLPLGADAIAVLPAPVGAPGAAAVPERICVRIVDGVFDVPGVDTARLHGEWILLKNVCSTSVGIGRWTVSDYGRAHTYTFPKGFRLAAGASVRLVSGKGNSGKTTRFWGKDQGEIWGQGPSERAYLRNKSGVLVFSWSAYTDTVIAGAGDIATCGVMATEDEKTAALLQDIPGTVVTMGDNAYPDGSPHDFNACYVGDTPTPSWGQFKSRTYPAPGNNEYKTADAAAYFGYFGTRAGNRDQGYYSYDRGAWHVVVLNSECHGPADLGDAGCSDGSQQLRWLHADLDAHPAECTLAYWHEPEFSSGQHRSTTHYDAFWRELMDHGAELVLNGNDHDYERFAPQDANGDADPDGIVEIISGTGGAGTNPLNWADPLAANSVTHNGSTHGVLRLDLHPDGYDFAFVPVTGMVFSDSGSATCH